MLKYKIVHEINTLEARQWNRKDVSKKIFYKKLSFSEGASFA